MGGHDVGRQRLLPPDADREALLERSRAAQAGKEIHAEASDQDLYAAIDLLIDKLDRQVIKYKAKQKDHGNVTHKQQHVEP